jgi:hypothetical protein
VSPAELIADLAARAATQALTRGEAELVAAVATLPDPWHGVLAPFVPPLLSAGRTLVAQAFDAFAELVTNDVRIVVDPRALPPVIKVGP